MLNVAPYIRRDEYRYLPSADLLNDLGPIQQESVGQNRSLTNAGVHSDLSFTTGRNSVKFGMLYQQTFLRERDTLGIVDPNLIAPCVDGNGNPLSGSPDQCGTPGTAGDSPSPNPKYAPVLAPYDLTRGGSTYTWFGHTDVKQLALYGEDSFKAGAWQFDLSVRGFLQRAGDPAGRVSRVWASATT